VEAILADVQVLDLSRLLPGPYCSRILADFGAEVVKVEHPHGGDWVRYVLPLGPDAGDSLLFRVLNRGKKSLTLDLKQDAGRRILLQLIKHADVLLESFRPGVMARLGLGYEKLAAVNPRLVYCALSGYGPSGPYRERAGHDLNYVGLAGLLDLTGARDGPPVVPGVPLADLTGGVWAALGVVLALLARERSGKGQRLDGTLLGAALACMPLALADYWGGQSLERGAGSLTGGWACYNVYGTKDGHYVTLAALEPQFWTAFCRAVGREHLVPGHLSPALAGDPVYKELCALFRSRTRREWAEALAEVDACCEPVYALDEALSSAPVQALAMLTPEGLRPPVNPSDQRPVEPKRAPYLGEHTEALLKGLGYGPEQIAGLEKADVV
jgi:crotonobetainyl-CoA:carnitine CoA-transferase CaiB-like acyl-CoA transferase